MVDGRESGEMRDELIEYRWVECERVVCDVWLLSKNDLTSKSAMLSNAQRWASVSI